jgi:hypothetical protein
MHQKDPQKMVPGAVEPNYNMNEEELLNITQYLVNLQK